METTRRAPSGQNPGLGEDVVIEGSLKRPAAAAIALPDQESAAVLSALSKGWDQPCYSVAEEIMPGQYGKRYLWFESRQSETSVPPNWDFDAGDARNASPIHGAPKRGAVRAITGAVGLCDKLEG